MTGEARRAVETSFSPERRALLAKLLEKKGIRPPGERTIPRRADPGRTDPGPAPLSFAQEAIWFLDQLEPDRALHSVPGAVRLTGQLDVGALERALAEIVARHEALRTSFVARDGKPFQVVAPPGSFSMPLVDLREHAKPEAEALRLATEEAHRPFDLERGPLFRAFLMRLGDSEHVLVLNFHHAIIDGWSMGVFTRELGQLYRAFRAGEPSPLGELPIQLADFAVWQRATVRGAALDEHLAYWRENLAGNPVGITLPADRPRPAVQSFQGRHRTIRLSQRLSEALRGLSQREGVTLFVTLTAAFQALLYHYRRETDVVIGSAVAQRDRRELEGLIGFLVNMVALRTDLSGDPPFRELLRRVRDVTVGAFANQELPLTHIIKEVQPERDLSRNPLFQIEFSLLTPDQNPAVYGYGLATGAIETLELPGLVMTPFPVQYENARYDVAVFLWDMPQGIHGTVEYSTDLFDDATIGQMVQRYEILLRAAAERPDASLDALVDRLDAAAREARTAAEQSYDRSLKQKLKSLKRRRAGGTS